MRAARGELWFANAIRLCHTRIVVKRTKAVRVNEQHLEKLEEIARKEGETVSFLIQQAIREYLERRAAGANR